MLVGRIRRETTDVSRVTVDFTPWLDASETLSAISGHTITLDQSGWEDQPCPPAQPPADPTPMTFVSCGILSGSQKVQFFVQSGTPGNAYTVQLIVLGGTSSRRLTVEVGVQVTGTPAAPVAQIPLNTVPGALPLLGGVMLGPLYLFEDPLQPTEAANKEYVDNLFLTLDGDITDEANARIAGDGTLSAAITAETARAEGVETGILTAKKLVAGVGLNGGTITLSGTTSVTGTISANYQAGTLSAFATGLTLAAGTLAANWQLGSATAIGSGVTLSSGTLSAGGSGGSITKIVAGGGLTGGTITASGTIGANWNAGAVTALGSSLSITSGTLNAAASIWNAGTVTTVGTGLALSAGTLASTASNIWNAGTVTTVGTGLALSAGTLALAGGGGSITLRTGTCSASNAGVSVAFSPAFATSVTAVLIHRNDGTLAGSASAGSATASGFTAFGDDGSGGAITCWYIATGVG